MKCPKCNFEFKENKSNKNYKTNKKSLKDYPNCFDNFIDCPEKPQNINIINSRCKMCSYYQYSEFRQEQINPESLSKQKKKLLNEFDTLTNEQQQELLNNIKKDEI